jgi:hypothetical protein
MYPCFKTTPEILCTIYNVQYNAIHQSNRQRSHSQLVGMCCDQNNQIDQTFEVLPTDDTCVSVKTSKKMKHSLQFQCGVESYTYDQKTIW